MPDRSGPIAWIAAAGAGATVVGACLLGVAVGGWDHALLPYAVALAVGTACLVERLTLWAQRPPTAALLRRGWRAGRQPRRWPSLLGELLGYFILQRFVARRRSSRWLAHWPIAVGCGLAFAIVLPLVFGWIHFQTPAEALDRYRLLVFGLPTIDFATDSLFAGLLFHGLVVASAFVLIGVGFALWRRGRDRGVRAVQRPGYDGLPLLLLAAMAVTGLLLTASYTWWKGAGYDWLAPLHLLTVVAFLLQVPFGKLLHVPQRILKLAQFFAADADDEAAVCRRCQQPFAGARQIAELQAVGHRLGFDYRLADGGHYQTVCPRCRRALLVLAQGRRWRQGRSLTVPRANGAPPLPATDEEQPAVITTVTGGD